MRCRAGHCTTGWNILHGAYIIYTCRYLRSGGARAEHNIGSRSTPFSIPSSALQGTQPLIAKSDRRHGACDFCDEPTAHASSMGLLLRHMQDRQGPPAPTGILPCSSLQVLFWSTRPFSGYVRRTPPCEFSVPRSRYLTATAPARMQGNCAYAYDMYT